MINDIGEFGQMYSHVTYLNVFLVRDNEKPKITHHGWAAEKCFQFQPPKTALKFIPESLLEI